MRGLIPAATIGVLVSIVVARPSFAQGFVLSGVGPVNSSMAGAGTAAPLDATGALHWNPGSITQFPQSRIDLGAQLIYNRNSVSSTLFADTPLQVSGRTRSKAGVAVLPATGIVYRPDDGPWTYGMGMSTIAGFFVNYAGSTTNPIFTSPTVTGMGPAYTRMSVTQMSPTIAYDFGNGLSFGIAPTINVLDLQTTPFFFTTPDDANMDGVFTYPPGTGNRPYWGLGLQAGLFYQSPADFSLGFTIKSPQWFERLEYHSQDELGSPRSVSTRAEYPMILSMGAAYTGIDYVVLAADVRWVDFASAGTIGDPATFDAGGELRGLGWESIWMVALGAQLELTERITVRTGYSFNQNPIPDRTATVNLLAPAIYQHVFALGSSVQLTESIVASLSWTHAFHNSISGPMLTPAGPVPLSDVTVKQTADTFSFAVSVLF